MASDIMKRLDTLNGAIVKLKVAADTRASAIFTHEECTAIAEHVDRLSKERESLHSSLAYYD